MAFTVDIERVAMVLSEAISNEQLAPFVEQVPFAEVPVYLDLVAYPIHIKLILGRLENKFYRHLDQVVWEWDRMCQNAFDFNSPRSVIYKLAKTILKPYRYKLAGISDPTVVPDVHDATIEDPSSGRPNQPTPNQRETELVSDEDSIVYTSTRQNLRLRLRLRERESRRTKRPMRLSTRKNKRKRYTEDDDDEFAIDDGIESAESEDYEEDEEED
jgi:hypothetical protein